MPAYLWLFVGPELIAAVDLAPFVDAFLLLIVLPLMAAGLTQYVASRTRWGRTLRDTALAAMVPRMMLTLAVVVASQVYGVSRQLPALLATVPIYAAFAAVMIPVGIFAGRAARLDVSSTRAVVFSGATRNSLVVLPLALALGGLHLGGSFEHVEELGRGVVHVPLFAGSGRDSLLDHRQPGAVE